MRTFIGLSVVCLGVLAMGQVVQSADDVLTIDVNQSTPGDADAKPQAAPLQNRVPLGRIEEVPATPLDVKMQTLDGKDVNLAKKYKGKVVLLVNVASKCGLTPQYKPLQALHDKYAEEGLAIVGVPCNQFNSQEPGTSAQIAEFCKANYGVEFDMLSKVDVNGEKAVPLYKWLTSKETNPKMAGPIKWNFEKFLFNRDGQLVARFEPKVKPDSKEVVTAIEAELTKKSADVQ